MYYIMVVLGAAAFVGYNFGYQGGIMALVVLGCVHWSDIVNEQKER